MDTENNSIILDFDDEEISSKQSTHKNDKECEPELNNIWNNLEHKLSNFFTELQMHRSGVYEKARFECEIKKYDEKQIELQKTLEYIKREGERAAAAAEKMAKELDSALKKLTMIEPHSKALEKENFILKDRVNELSISLEESSRKEREAHTYLETQDNARSHIEAQLQRLQRTINILQENQKQFEEDFRLLKIENRAYKELQEVKMAADVRQRQRFENSVAKLKEITEKHVKLLERLGEMENNFQPEMKIIGSAVNVENNHVEKLIMQLKEERSVTEALKEALQAATEAQTRLLALHPVGNTKL